jgi:hypothetical protein
MGSVNLTTVRLKFKGYDLLFVALARSQKGYIMAFTTAGDSQCRNKEFMSF